MSWRTIATWQSRRSRWPRDHDARSARPYWQRAATTFDATEVLRARPASHLCIRPDGSTASHHPIVLAIDSLEKSEGIYEDEAYFSVRMA